jgi:hypothetical protein
VTQLPQTNFPARTPTASELAAYQHDKNSAGKHGEIAGGQWIVIGLLMLVIVSMGAIMWRQQEQADQADEWRRTAQAIIRIKQDEGKVSSDIVPSTLTPETFRNALIPIGPGSGGRRMQTASR